MRVLDDRYELAEPLGRGGMSRVYAADDRVLGRRVAVKLLRDDLAADPVVRARLLREARAAASFTHPNAVAVHDVGEDGDQPFIVMELVEGRPLTELIREAGSLPVDDVVRIAGGMLAALAAAHERGLVHRDVKPGNVLVDAEGEARLADFGIAKGIAEATAGLTATGQVIGTPRYLSPEQAAGAPADARSDVYAAGVTCYEMLAGRPPFTGHHAVAIAFAHQHTPPAPLADARPDVPPALAALVHRALEKDPGARFASAGAMREALEDAAVDGGRTAVLPATPPPAATSDESEATETAAARQAQPAAARRGAWLWPGVAALALVLLAGFALAVLLPGDGADDQAAGESPAAGDGNGNTGEPDAEAREPAPADGEDGAEPEITDTADPEAGDPAAQLDETFAEVAAGLRADEERFGEKGPDLLEDLEEVLTEPDRLEQASEARDLMDDIEEWVADGELDPDIAARVIRELEDLLRAGREAEWGGE